ncbi:10629_t:CDS:2 [Diversispora eburnea]|uniref:10629_t:CDS:1 n=1 Tax=Diversispora eburnea TaxID=1213867 RepID=A0A9N9AR76_9GLOM|nr:10629_t:CDS:2 [Diversispora eburnea]
MASPVSPLPNPIPPHQSSNFVKTYSKSYKIPSCTPRNSCNLSSTLPSPPSSTALQCLALDSITIETLDNIINSVITPEERLKYEKKLFIPLQDLIFPSNRPKRNASSATRYQNSFIIFRKDYQARVTAELGPEIGSRLKEISQKASVEWRNLSSEDKYMYDRISACTKKLNEKIWPNYLHKPSRKFSGNYGYSDNRMIDN